jgi:hypothetical protein
MVRDSSSSFERKTAFRAATFSDSCASPATDDASFSRETGMVWRAEL